jgi:hypothetical protein
MVYADASSILAVVHTIVVTVTRLKTATPRVLARTQYQGSRTFGAHS